MSYSNGSVGTCACGRLAIASCQRCGRTLCDEHARTLPPAPEGISANALGRFELAIRLADGPHCEGCRADIGNYALEQINNAPRAQLPEHWLDRAIALSGDQTRSDEEKRRDADLPGSLTAKDVAAEFLRRIERPAQEQVPVTPPTILRSPEYPPGLVGRLPPHRVHRVGPRRRPLPRCPASSRPTATCSARRWRRRQARPDVVDRARVRDRAAAARDRRRAAARAQRVHAAAAARRPTRQAPFAQARRAMDAARLLADLVAIDSVNPALVPGAAGEAEIAAYVAAWLGEHGLEVTVVDEPRGRPSVVGVARGTGGGAALMLNAHTGHRRRRGDGPPPRAARARRPPLRARRLRHEGRPGGDHARRRRRGGRRRAARRRDRHRGRRRGARQRGRAGRAAPLRRRRLRRHRADAPARVRRAQGLRLGASSRRADAPRTARGRTSASTRSPAWAPCWRGSPRCRRASTPRRTRCWARPACTRR